MRSVFSAKRWISVFANVQDTAIVNARNVMNCLLHHLKSQEGRTTFYGLSTGHLRPVLATTGKPCHRPGMQPESRASGIQDRLSIHSW